MLNNLMLFSFVVMLAGLLLAETDPFIGAFTIGADLFGLGLLAAFVFAMLSAIL